jgi:heme-degrading monooxygenase HmoA
MATAEPQSGRERELIERMKSFADLLRPMPGLVNVFVLREEETGALVGLSIWQDKESYDRGMEKASSQPSKSELTREPPRMRQFTEI